MADLVARSVTVHGRVQGVFFRDSTRDAASAAGVVGWARNADDGTVRLHLEGPIEAVERVLAFVRSGPPQAEVSEVEVVDAEPGGHSDFRTG